MSNFKRNDSSRFARGGNAPQGNSRPAQIQTRSGAPTGGGSPSIRPRSGGPSRALQQNQSGQRQGDFPFTRIGSLTIPKSIEEKNSALADAIYELRGSEVQLNCKIYLGKDDGNQLILKNGDMLTISCRVTDKDKEYVIGHVSVKN